LSGKETVLQVGETYRVVDPEIFAEKLETGTELTIERVDSDGDGWFLCHGLSSFITPEDIRKGYVKLAEYPLEGKVVLVNGPIGSGKDTAADILCGDTGAKKMEFKDHLYACTAILFNIPLDELKEMATDRTLKEIPTPKLIIPQHGYNALYKVIDPEGKIMHDCAIKDREISPRQALIFVSEVLIKPNLGIEYFGRIAAENCYLERGTVFSDSGFQHELDPIVDKFGAENVTIVQLERDGTSFEGDSRNYVEREDINVARIENNDDFFTLGQKLLGVVIQ
jgi:hypothetical protein